MLSDLEKGKLKECWTRVSQSPAAGYVFAKGKGKNGADVTVGSIHQFRVNNKDTFEKSCEMVENMVREGYHTSVDDYIAMDDWFFQDPANITRSIDDVRAEWQKIKLTP